MDNTNKIDRKISVVIPVYNVEKYLSQCLESVINQTFKNIEIICINDCSTDNSEAILKKYEENDSRIKIISNPKNKGIGFTRNLGQKLASGEYIFFIDSDDYITTDCLERLYEKITKDKSEVVYFNAVKFNEEENDVLPKIDMGKVFKDNIPQEPFYSIKKCKYLLKESGEIWYKLYSRKFLMKNSIFCSEHRLCEDRYFRINLLLSNPKTSILNETLYYYRLRKNGIFGQPRTDYSDIFDINKKCIDRIIKSDISYKNKLIFIKYQIRWLIIWTNKAKYSNELLAYHAKLRKKSYRKVLKYFSLKKLLEINLSKTFWNDLCKCNHRNFEVYLDYNNGNPEFVINIAGKHITYNYVAKAGIKTKKQLIKSIFSIYNKNEYKMMNLMGYAFKIKKRKAL